MHDGSLASDAICRSASHLHSLWSGERQRGGSAGRKHAANCSQASNGTKCLWNKASQIESRQNKDKIEPKRDSLSFPPSAREPLQSQERFFPSFASRVFPLEADPKADMYRKGEASVRLPNTVEGVYATKSLWKWPNICRLATSRLSKQLCKVPVHARCPAHCIPEGFGHYGADCLGSCVQRHVGSSLPLAWQEKNQNIPYSFNHFGPLRHLGFMDWEHPPRHLKCCTQMQWSEVSVGLRESPLSLTSH